MNAYYFWLLIAKIKNSDLVKDIRSFYRDDPWPATLILSGAMFFTGLMCWLVFLVIYLTWPDSLYVLLSGVALVTTARAILNWISKE